MAFWLRGLEIFTGGLILVSITPILIWPFYILAVGGVTGWKHTAEVATGGGQDWTGGGENPAGGNGNAG